jgi:hypothetical protein
LTGREAVYLIGWSLIVTSFLQISHWSFMTIPAPVLTIIGAALAIILGFKNQQCYARFNEALVFSGQLSSNSLILANRLMATIGRPDDMRSGPVLSSEKPVVPPFGLADGSALHAAREKVLGEHDGARECPFSGGVLNP